jgi:hypothetical protein
LNALKLTGKGKEIKIARKVECWKIRKTVKIMWCRKLEN